MSVKTECVRRDPESFSVTTVYVVNPEQLRQKVILQSLKLGKPKKSDDSSDTASTVDTTTNHHVLTTDRKPRKRRIESDEGVFEDEDDSTYSKTHTREVTTRAGRVSKIRQAGPVASKNTKPTVAAEGAGPKVKKREPASVFRCATCQKVYIGYSKLKLHFRKFPDHYTQAGVEASSSGQDTQGKSICSVDTTHVETQTDFKIGGAEKAVQTNLNEYHNKFEDQVVARNVQPNFASFGSLLEANTADAVAGFRNIVPHTQAVECSRTFCNGAVSTHKEDHGLFVAPSLNASVACDSISTAAVSIHGVSPAVVSKTESHGVPVSPTIPRVNGLTSQLHSDGSHNGPGPFHKILWDLVEEKMIQHGINEILSELADVAEKLSKIARDKIIPIREEEEEQLRMNNTAPIVQVDTPFLSHLLDLPFGTYMFKEDAGVRRALPPPVPADISLNSLTSGVEVDIDKFLPGIDLIHLPHLTNLDFSSI